MPQCCVVPNCNGNYKSGPKVHAIIRRLVLLHLVLELLCSDCSASYSATLVRTCDGQVRGIQLTAWKNRTFSAYRGIPYAMPPVGARRFRSPMPPDPWTTVREADKDGPQCPQMERGQVVGNEDCLYLNVYTHPGASKFPVLVWFHRGSFCYGEKGPCVLGPHYLMENDMVLVVPAYRIGALGFLSTGDGVMSGNYGLKDQVEVLRWVQRNIASFGGNPDAVTIGGSGAGAVSAILHLMSPLSKGLFHGVISFGGSPLNFWALNRNPKEQIIRIAEKLKCATDSSIAIRTCLVEVPAADLAALCEDCTQSALPINTPFSPIIENVPTSCAPPFLNEDPITLLKEGAFDVTVPLLMGVTSDEGLPLAQMVNDDQELKEKLECDCQGLLATLLDNPPVLDEQFQGIRDCYACPEGTPTLEELSALISDIRYFYPVFMTASEIVRHGKPRLFFMIFAYQGRVSDATTHCFPRSLHNASHADEIIYLFRNRMTSFGGDMLEEEILTIERMTSIVFNFVKTRDLRESNCGAEDTACQKLRPRTWTPADKCCFRYLLLADDVILVTEEPFLERVLCLNKVMEAAEEAKKQSSCPKKVDQCGSEEEKNVPTCRLSEEPNQSTPSREEQLPPSENVRQLDNEDSQTSNTPPSENTGDTPTDENPQLNDVQSKPCQKRGNDNAPRCPLAKGKPAKSDSGGCRLRKPPEQLAD